MISREAKWMAFELIEAHGTSANEDILRVSEWLEGRGLDDAPEDVMRYLDWLINE